MTKKLIAIAAAMLMLTACGTVNSPAEESSVTETSADTFSEAVSESENETDTEAVNELSAAVYDGNYYTITVDPEKWTNANDMKQAAGEVAESLDNSLDFSAEEFSEMCDAIFNYNTPESSFSANFNIVTQDTGVDMDMDAEVFGPVMEEGYKDVEGYDLLSWEGVTVNGYDCLIININVEQMNIKMRMKQYIFLKGGKQTVVTFTADEEEFDRILPDFEEAVNTITLK